jgi:hypothetical protein
MRVKVEQAFGPYSKGQEIPEMPGNQARTMIDRGYVREVMDKAPVNRGSKDGRKPDGGAGSGERKKRFGGLL